MCRRAPEDHARPSSWCQVGHHGRCDYANITLADICDVPFGGIHAIWFSGELRIPQGELVTYVHAGWASGYERDLIVEVQRGTVVSEKIVRIAAIDPPTSRSRWRRWWAKLW